MAKLNESYELMVIYSVKSGEDKVKELVEKFKGMIEANGTVESVDEWGKRKLAYDIDFQSEGYYTLYTFSSEPDFPKEIERVLSITDGVMRWLVTVK